MEIYNDEEVDIDVNAPIIDWINEIKRGNDEIGPIHHDNEEGRAKISEDEDANDNYDEVIDRGRATVPKWLFGGWKQG